VADYKRLNIIVILSAGCGIADMPDSNVSFLQPVKRIPVEDFSHKPVSLKMLKDPIPGHRDSAAFLAPVLQRIQPEINVLCYIFPVRGPDSKHTTFFMHVDVLQNKKRQRISDSFALRE
jgi:hypothetical protein